MLVIWALFLLVIARIVASAALHADRLAAAARVSRRFIWIAALTATAIWPAIAIATLSTGEIALRHGFGIDGVRDPRHLPMLSLRVPLDLIPARLEAVFTVVWALASAALLLRLAAFAYLSSRWRRALPIAVVDGVRVRMSESAGPAVGGLIAAELIIPAWVTTLEPLDRSLVMTHELSHRSARDIYLLWFAAFLTALVPWNFVLWWQAAQLRRAIEIDCDARVLKILPHRTAYAQLLVRIASEPRGRTWSLLAPALTGEASCLEQRIAAMSPQRELPVHVRAVHGLIVVIAIAAALALRVPR